MQIKLFQTGDKNVNDNLSVLVNVEKWMFIYKLKKQNEKIIGGGFCFFVFNTYACFYVNLKFKEHFLNFKLC